MYPKHWMPFPITCAACHKTFSIADDVFERKVKGRVVTIKCKQCQSGIRVDSTKERPVFSVSDSMRPPPVAPVTAGAEVARAAPARVGAGSPPGAVPKLPTAPVTKASASTVQRAAPIAAVPKATPKAATPTAGKVNALTAGAATARQIPPTPKAPPAAPALKAPTPAFPADAVAAAKSAATAIAPPAGAVENLWAVDYPDGEDRELTLAEIERELLAGAIDVTTLVWREGMDEWLELGQLPELRALQARRAPKPPPPSPAQRRPAPSESGFGPESDLSVTLPQPTLPLPAQRPPAVSAPVIDFAEHDAREAQAAPVPKPRFSTGRDSRPPTPPALLSSANLPAESGPVKAAGAVAPLAPVGSPPLARPMPTPLGAVAPIANVEDWPPKSRVPLVIGVAALLAVGGLIVFLMRSPADRLPPLTPISALPAVVPSVRPADPLPSAALSNELSAPVEDSAPSKSAVMQAPAGAPLTTANAGFAELFADGARGADQKHGANGPGQRFDVGAAKAALASAAGQTARCRERGGPTGKATVMVTFEPSGKVASATISDSPFAGTSSGACIVAALKLAVVPAFSGSPGTVTKVLSIQ